MKQVFSYPPLFRCVFKYALVFWMFILISAGVGNPVKSKDSTEEDPRDHEKVFKAWRGL
jgi:hypothetical protein